MPNKSMSEEMIVSIAEVINRHLSGLYVQQMATPVVPHYLTVIMAKEIAEEVMSTGEVILSADQVDDHTNSLIERLVQQNRTLEKAANLYAEQIAKVDFITLDRDMWRRRCTTAEREAERLSMQVAREDKS